MSNATTTHTERVCVFYYVPMPNEKCPCLGVGKYLLLPSQLI